ncbi:hypothetical protein ABTJ53_18810, partial [Acinetobacter baumannii]
LAATTEEQITGTTAALKKLHEILRVAEQKAKAEDVARQVLQYGDAFRSAVKAINERQTLDNDVNAKLADEISQELAAVRTSQAKMMAQTKASSEA